MDALSSIIAWNEERGLDKRQFNIDTTNNMLVEELMELNGLEDDEHQQSIITSMLYQGTLPAEAEQIDALCDIVVVAVGEMLKLGYDPHKAMAETLKEIHSRAGGTNQETGKWEKFTDDESVSRHYKAKYTDCVRDLYD